MPFSRLASDIHGEAHDLRAVQGGKPAKGNSFGAETDRATAIHVLGTTQDQSSIQLPQELMHVTKSNMFEFE